MRFILLSGGTSGADSFAGLFSIATEFVTWVISAMSDFLKFIVDNPVVLAFFIITLVGSAVGFLMRIWRSV